MYVEARRQILEQCLCGDYYLNPSHVTTRWATKKGSEEPWAWDALKDRISVVPLAVVDLTRRGIRKISPASPNSHESGYTFVFSAEMKRIRGTRHSCDASGSAMNVRAMSPDPMKRRVDRRE